MTTSDCQDGRPSAHFGAFSLVRAACVAEVLRAAALRRRAFMERRGVSLDEDTEARRDESAHVFLLFDGSTLVATARVSPYPSISSPLPVALCEGLGADSELSRVVCSSTQAESGARYSALLLTLGAQYLLAYTPLRRYVAYAHPKLCAPHGRLGAVDTGRRCIVPQREQPYHILTGCYADTWRFGSALLGIGALQRSA